MWWSWGAAHGEAAHHTGGLVGGALVIVALVAAGAGYLWAAYCLVRRGETWSWANCVAFIAGEILLSAVVLLNADRLADPMSVHIGRHLVLMMVVAPLLVAGAPVRLLLRVLSPTGRTAVSEVLQDRLVRGLTAGWPAGVFLAVDYYGSMAVYLHTPLLRWSFEHSWLQVAAHVYFLLCGVLFWAPLLGEDLAGWRPSLRAAVAMTAIGVPANLLLGWSLMWSAPHMLLRGADGAAAAAWTAALGGAGLSLIAVTVVSAFYWGGCGGASRLYGVEETWPAAS